jgi:hypothetical protein
MWLMQAKGNLVLCMQVYACVLWQLRWGMCPCSMTSPTWGSPADQKAM